MKKAILLTPLILTACLFSTKYTGDSFADSILKSDIERSVRMMFQAHYDCGQIDEIHTRIEEFKLLPNQQTVDHVTEIWTASGCGNTQAYRIFAKTDQNYETDFRVSELSGN